MGNVVWNHQHCGEILSTIIPGIIPGSIPGIVLIYQCNNLRKCKNKPRAILYSAFSPSIQAHTAVHSERHSYSRQSMYDYNTTRRYTHWNDTLLYHNAVHHFSTLSPAFSTQRWPSAPHHPIPPWAVGFFWWFCFCEDVAYTSFLKRAIKTCWHTLEQTGLVSTVHFNR